MELRARLVHAESGRRVVEVRAWQGDRLLGSALGEAADAEQAEDRARERLLARLHSTVSPAATSGHGPAATGEEQGGGAREREVAAADRRPKAAVTTSAGPAGVARRDGDAAAGRARLAAAGSADQQERPVASGVGALPLAAAGIGVAAAPAEPVTMQHPAGARPSAGLSPSGAWEPLDLPPHPAVWEQAGAREPAVRLDPATTAEPAAALRRTPGPVQGATSRVMAVPATSPAPEQNPGPGSGQAVPPGAASGPAAAAHRSADPQQPATPEPTAAAQPVVAPEPGTEADQGRDAFSSEIAAEHSRTGDRPPRVGEPAPEASPLAWEPPPDPEDWSSDLAALDLQLRRLGWDREREALYLQRAFGHPSRNRLTNYSDLRAYLQTLARLDVGSDPTTAAVPLRRSELLHQCDTLLAQLGWNADQGRSFLARELQAASRQQLNDQQLLHFNMLLESEMLAAASSQAAALP